MYVKLILSPSMSVAPLAAQVSVPPTPEVFGLSVAAVTVGAVFPMVTTFERDDSALSAVPSFAIAVQDKVSPLPNRADVKVLPFVGP